MGRGGGAFSPVPLSNAAPGGTATGDFDGDGHLDVAATYLDAARSILVARAYFGDGHGHFSAGAVVDLGTQFSANLAAADWDGDGATDLATTAYRDGSVLVLLADHHRGFTVGRLFVGGAPDNVAAADLDGDGHPELVVTDEVASNVLVFPGHADGSFGASLVLPAGGPLFLWGAISVGLIDGDCRPDLVVARADNAIAVFLNDAR